MAVERFCEASTPSRHLPSPPDETDGPFSDIRKHLEAVAGRAAPFWLRGLRTRKAWLHATFERLNLRAML